MGRGFPQSGLYPPTIRDPSGGLGLSFLEIGPNPAVQHFPRDIVVYEVAGGREELKTGPGPT